jgi:hypothetical protein
MIERQAVVGVFEDCGEGLEETAGPVSHFEVLDVIADREALPPDYLRLSGGRERSCALRRSQWLHGASFKLVDMAVRPNRPASFTSARAAVSNKAL